MAPYIFFTSIVQAIAEFEIAVLVMYLGKKEKIQKDIAKLFALMCFVLFVQGIYVFVDFTLHATDYINRHLLLVPRTSVNRISKT